MSREKQRKTEVQLSEIVSHADRQDELCDFVAHPDRMVFTVLVVSFSVTFSFPVPQGHFSRVSLHPSTDLRHIEKVSPTSSELQSAA